MNEEAVNIAHVLKKHSQDFFPVLPFDAKRDTALPVRLKDIAGLTPEVFQHTDLFCDFMQQYREKAKATYLYGGYREVRDIYLRSKLFGTGDEQRTLHLGVDVWCAAGTPVTTPIGGMIHSFAYNEGLGNYGATIIMQYQLETFNFYVLYGHLSLKNLIGLEEGVFLTRGTTFAHIGNPDENGSWPPHLHIQIIGDIGFVKGDYPGVCKLSEAQQYLGNSPDPTILLPFS